MNVLAICIFFFVMIMDGTADEVASGPDPNGRMCVNCDDAPVGRKPWMVRLDDIGCGGALIGGYMGGVFGATSSPIWVLTAAHCFDGYTKKIVKISGGHVKLSWPYRTVEWTRLSNVIIHPKYDRRPPPKSYAYDIALIKLERPMVNIGQYSSIGIIRYNPSDNRPVEGVKWVSIMGWGSTKWRGSGRVDHLQEAKVKVVGHQDQKKMWLTLSQEDGTGSCDGDSGGPAVAYPGHDRFVIGVSSHGTMKSCSDPRGLNVYTNVGRFIGWIKKHVGFW